MKAEILKLAKVKNEQEFYKKFPTEKAFMAKYGKQLAKLKKAKVGDMIAGDITTPNANQPLYYDDLTSNTEALVTGINPQEKQRREALSSQQAIASASGKSNQGGIADILGNIDPEMIASAFGKNGKKLKKAAGGFEGLIKPPAMPKVEMTNLSTKKDFGLTKLSDPGTSPDRSFDWKGLAGQAAGAIGPIAGAIQQYDQQSKDLAKSKMYGNVSDVVLQAQSSTPELSKRRYVRPEDSKVSGMNPLGARTNYLAAENGAEIQNTYAPDVIYTDLGYEPLNDSNVKQYRKGGKMRRAEGGVNLDPFAGIAGGIGGSLGSSAGKGSGKGGPGSTIGSTLGGIAGSFIPIPGVGTALGSLAGGFIGGLFDAQDQNEQQAAQDKLDQNMQGLAFQSGARNIQQTNKGFMEDGGWVSHDWQPQVIASFGEHSMKDLLAPDPMMDTLRAGGHLSYYTPPSERAMSTERAEYGMQMAMGGDLEVHRGAAETISYNPFLPNGGETVMFRGPSHDNGGMPVSYGQNGVEVEGGEPAMVMKDGGKQDNLVVFGNMRIPDYGANEIGDKKAKGMKFKRYIADLSKQEAKNNKTMDKSFDLINSSNTDDPFDQLSFNSGQAMLMGSQMQLKSIADKKLSTSAVQNAILDTADEYGLDSAKLAEKNIAKFGGKFGKADVGTSLSSKTPVGRVIDDLYERFRPKTDPNFKGWNRIEKEQKPASKPAAAPARAAAPASTAKPVVPAATKPAQAAIKSNAKASTPGAPKKSFDINSVSDFIKKIPFTEREAMAKVMGVPNFRGTAEQNQFLLNKTQQSDIAPLTPITPGYAASKTLQPVSAMNKSISAGDFGHDPNSITGEDSGVNWETIAQTALSGVYPFIRPTSARPLDPSQLTPEMLAMAMNQQEPVSAQLYNPMLTQATSISLQDQLNEVTAQSRAAEKMAAYNPEAASIIFGQVADSKNKILGEQFRMNQAEKQRVSEQNAAVLNDAQMKNLAILDQQFVRQAQAKSNTKQQAMEISKSIADKIAQNKLENKQVTVMENMYPAFNFTPEGVAYKNPMYMASFAPGLGSSKNQGKGTLASGYGYTYDENRNIIGTRKLKSDESGRNGAIVKAIKNL